MPTNVFIRTCVTESLFCIYSYMYHRIFILYIWVPSAYIYIYIYVMPNLWNCPVHELGASNAQFVKWAIGLPSSWTGQEKYCPVHELCNARAREKTFRAQLFVFSLKHNNVVNIEFWWCHITIFCMQSLFCVLKYIKFNASRKHVNWYTT